MPPTLLQILILGLIQGAAELLPVSSSAHVIVAEKFMKLDPSSPPMTFLLVMLHTGTMFAVIAYFWRSWRESFFSSRAQFAAAAKKIILASLGSAAVYLILKHLIEKVVLGGGKAEVEQLFSSLPLIAGALFAAGILILWSAFQAGSDAAGREVGLSSALWMGLVQGLALPFRGFSRSGSTISVGMLTRAGRRQVEVFSFALAVVLTPAAIAQELLRLLKSRRDAAGFAPLAHMLQPGLFGMVCSFVAGLLALVWLSRWLENGRWHYFGYYCMGVAAIIFVLAARGF
jgi:undecaprenyl-diphosphatase